MVSRPGLPMRRSVLASQATRGQAGVSTARVVTDTRSLNSAARVSVASDQVLGGALQWSRQRRSGSVPRKARCYSAAARAEIVSSLKDWFATI